jgi:hypothetical protein
MLKKNQQFGVYTIKDILYDDGLKTCCLTEDPFFHSTVLLNVIEVETLEISGQRHNLENKFDRLHLLEHPGIAAIYDSGYEGDYFYYTTSYNYQESLADLLGSQSVGDPLKLLIELADSCAYAAEQGVSHGPLRAEEIHFNDHGRALIADFGVVQIFSLLGANRPLAVQNLESLNAFGGLLLQLLTGTVDCTGSEAELLEQLDQQPLKQIAADLLGLGERSYASFDDLCEALKTERLSAENSSSSEEVKSAAKQPQNTDGSNLTVREKSQVLPQVRQLINEKNQLVLLLDKASLEKNRIINQLSQARQTINELESRQGVEEIDDSASRGGKLLLVCALSSFFIGLLTAGIWVGSADDAPEQSQVVERQVFTDVVLFDEPPLAPIEDVVAADVDNVEIVQPLIEPPQPVQPFVVTAEALPETEPVAFAEDGLDLLPADAVPLSEPSGWWPAGQEFSENAPFTEEVVASAGTSISENSVAISTGLQTEIFESLKGWAGAWSSQDVQEYLSYYSTVYQPSSGSSRSQWAVERRKKLERPEWIKINIDNIQLERQGTDHLQARFEQSYQSNSFQDRVSKELELVLEEGHWKIEREKNRPL